MRSSSWKRCSTDQRGCFLDRSESRPARTPCPRPTPPAPASSRRSGGRRAGPRRSPAPTREAAGPPASSTSAPSVRSRPLIDEHADVLLRVQRVPAGPREQCRAQLGGQLRGLEEVGDQARGLVVGERLELQDGRAGAAGTPAHLALQELRTAGCHDEERSPETLSEQAGDELEQAVVAPVEILEDEHERPTCRDRLEEPPPGGEGLGTAVAAQLVCRCEACERRELSLDPAGVVRVGDDVLDGETELLLDDPGRVGRQDAGVSFDDLGQRPERDAVAVRKAAALTPEDHLHAALEALRELPDQARLADPGRADESREPRLFVRDRLIEEPGERVQLALPAHEWAWVAEPIRSPFVRVARRLPRPARASSCPWPESAAQAGSRSETAFPGTFARPPGFRPREPRSGCVRRC